MTNTAVTVELVTFEVEVGFFQSFEVEFARLAKKAAKLGVLAPTYVVLARDKVYPAVIGEAGNVTRRARTVNVIQVSGQAPKLAGWTFVAALQHEVGGNIVRSIPGTTTTVVQDLRMAPAKCDHCKQARNRNDTYVVVNDDGRQVQVGRQCLKDFTGHDSPEAIARWAELLASFVTALDEGGEGGEGGGYHLEAVTTLDAYFPYVIASIRLTGWMSRSKARDSYVPVQSTSDHVWASIFPAPQKTDELGPLITDTDRARAKECLKAVRAYFEANDIAQLSDYEHNVRIVVDSVSVVGRTAGIAASIVPFAERLLGQEVERRRLASRSADGQYVGTVGKREAFTLTCVKVLDLETAYGTSHLHLFVDDAGNSVKWFSSTQRLNPGDKYSVKGTVKAHEEYKGAKQTMLSRCACTRIEKV